MKKVMLRYHVERKGWRVIDNDGREHFAHIVHSYMPCRTTHDDIPGIGIKAHITFDDAVVSFSVAGVNKEVVATIDTGY